MKTMVIVETCLCICMEGLAIIGVIMGHAPLLLAAGVVLGVAAAGWAFLYALYYGKISRRRRQMRWLLAHLNESAPTAPAAPATSSEAQLPAQASKQAPTRP